MKEELSPAHVAGGNFVDLTVEEPEDSYSDLSSESDEPLATPEELEEHKLVEVSIASVRREESVVQRVVEETFDSLRSDRVRALLRARNETKKQTRIWMAAAAKGLAQWKASSSGDPLTNDAEASSNGKGPACDIDVVVLSDDDDDDDA